MKVFKACMNILKRRLTAFLIYLVIFIALCVFMASFSSEQYNTNFTETKPSFTIINRDTETPLINGLFRYLNDHGTEVELEDRQDALQDAAFFHASDYILIVPEGFSKAFPTASPLSLQTVTSMDSARGYYADSLVNQYLNLIKICQTATPDMNEQKLVSSVLDDLSLETRVEKKLFGNEQPVPETYQNFNRMQAYIFIVLLIFSISMVMMVFRRPDLHIRNLCAPLKSYSFTLQLALYSGVVSIIIWLLLTVTGFVLYRNELSSTSADAIALILLNSFLFTLVSLSIAMVASSFIRSSSMQNSVGNFVSLGLSFLGGVFVPLEMLGDNMVAIAKFTPTYWYITALNQICGLTVFNAETLRSIWQAFFIQFGFAAALMCVSLVINKYRNQAESSFGSTETEIEA